MFNTKSMKNPSRWLGCSKLNLFSNLAMSGKSTGPVVVKVAPFQPVASERATFDERTIGKLPGVGHLKANSVVRSTQ